VASSGDRHSKTEMPTAKKKKDARKKGQVARSPEIGGWFSLLILTFVMPAAFGYAESKILAVQTMAAQVMAHPTIPGALTVLTKGLEEAILIILPFAGIIAVIGTLASVAQVGFTISAKGITPQFSKLNPINGLKRLFSARGLWELGKTVIKLGVIALFATRDIIGLMHTLMGAQPVAMGPLIDYAGAELLGFVRVLAVIGFLLGLADFAFQRHKLSADLKMTKHEVKEEMRETQGDPRHKGEIRKRQRAMSRLRMMAEVSRADMVITNPTHYAVALRYDRSRSSAPRVVAKGSDEVAARIREEATRHGVPIVEDPPLARAVYGACDLQDEIPEALYMAVARLLAFVYSLSPALKSVRPIHRRGASALVA
jgi:flagellar biosynthesis protein FlhB